MALYLGSLGKSERLRIFNPKPLVARELYKQLKSIKKEQLFKLLFFLFQIC
jgi:hypothetical protein